MTGTITAAPTTAPNPCTAADTITAMLRPAARQVPSADIFEPDPGRGFARSIFFGIAQA
ncbi:hypothetical protein MUNTM_08200 [Mycobacterium sp. MUNTM1]